MPTFKLTLAYDGTEFVGWQRQAEGTSIQGLLEDALHELDGAAVAAAGAGRTDAGVHAFGQVASASLQRDIAPDVLHRALNAHLPAAVRVMAVEPAPPTFNARFDARSKHYRYRIWNGPAVSPFERLYTWHIVGHLDVAAMDAAARRLEGRHDFAAFQTAGSSVVTTTRTMTLSRVSVQETAEAAEHAEDSSLITYNVVGEGFLRHMVRSIVGTLVDIGLGRQPVAWIDDVLASADRSAAGRTAPAAGLLLVGVSYQEHKDRNGR